MRVLILFLAITLLTACSSITSRNNPEVDLKQFKRFYIEHRLNDNNATDAKIAAELRSRGFTATHGPLTMMPNDTQVVITYDARWTWDFRSYLINLNITAMQAHSNKLIVTGTYLQTGILPKSPEKMISVLVDDFFHDGDSKSTAK